MTADWVIKIRVYGTRDTLKPNYTVGQKKEALSLQITLPKLGWFSTFFHCPIQYLFPESNLFPYFQHPDVAFLATPLRHNLCVVLWNDGRLKQQFYLCLKMTKVSQRRKCRFQQSVLFCVLALLLITDVQNVPLVLRYTKSKWPLEWWIGSSKVVWFRLKQSIISVYLKLSTLFLYSS